MKPSRDLITSKNFLVQESISRESNSTNREIARPKFKLEEKSHDTLTSDHDITFSYIAQSRKDLRSFDQPNQLVSPRANQAVKLTKLNPRLLSNKGVTFLEEHGSKKYLGMTNDLQAMRSSRVTLGGGKPLDQSLYDKHKISKIQSKNQAKINEARLLKHRKIGDLTITKSHEKVNFVETLRS